MNILHKLMCRFWGHDWHNDNHYPTHGWKEIPHADSYCTRCHTTGAA